MYIKHFISEQQIKNRVREIAANISKNNKKIIIISVLKGSFIFAADLIRELSKNNINFEIYFLKAKSYFGKASTGKIKIEGNISFIKEKNVLILEDIYDTGLTLKKIYEKIKGNNPKQIEIAVLLWKEKSRKFDLPINYIGFKIPDKFVVGYGLDYNEKFRGLPYIGVIEE